jgi:hypothetical protein
MTLLDLVQTLRQESGIAGNGPTTTINQSGELGRLVNWIKQAYLDIQDKNTSWNFMRKTFTFDCVIGTQNYDGSQIPDLRNWKPYSNRIYLNTPNNEWFLQFIPWEEFRDYRGFGASRAQTRRAIECTINPAKELVLWPIPDNTYTVTGEYFRTPHVMLLDADVPLFPQFHMCIVFNALMRYASYVADPSLYAYAQKEYLKTISMLENDQLEQIKFAGPLA